MCCLSEMGLEEAKNEHEMCRKKIRLQLYVADPACATSFLRICTRARDMKITVSVLDASQWHSYERSSPFQNLAETSPLLCVPQRLFSDFWRPLGGAAKITQIRFRPHFHFCGRASPAQCPPSVTLPTAYSLLSWLLPSSASKQELFVPLILIRSSALLLHLFAGPQLILRSTFSIRPSQHDLWWIYSRHGLPGPSGHAVPVGPNGRRCHRSGAFRCRRRQLLGGTRTHSGIGVRRRQDLLKGRRDRLHHRGAGHLLRQRHRRRRQWSWQRCLWYQARPGTGVQQQEPTGEYMFIYVLLTLYEIF